MNCNEGIGLRVVPIFYDVNPSYVRYQKGLFGEAFMQNQPENLEIWKKALVKVSSFAGWYLNGIHKRDEATIIESIIDGIENERGGFQGHHPCFLTQLLLSFLLKETLILGTITRTRIPALLPLLAMAFLSLSPIVLRKNVANRFMNIIRGLAIGVLNLAIVVPQMIVSLSAGPWDALFGGRNVPAFVLASLSSLAAGIIATLKLPMPRNSYIPIGFHVG